MILEMRKKLMRCEARCNGFLGQHSCHLTRPTSYESTTGASQAQKQSPLRAALPTRARHGASSNPLNSPMRLVLSEPQFYRQGNQGTEEERAPGRAAGKWRSWEWAPAQSAPAAPALNGSEASPVRQPETLTSSAGERADHKKI